ncbi:MAG TPA: alpha/beta fold hydrolase [Phycisphaerae bacterium]|nr:alpha/beta fold hydrolase [Phycisphaerae bacterium]
MKSNRRVAVGLCLTSIAVAASPVLAGPKSKKEPASAQRREKRADAVVKALAAGKYADATKWFDKTLKGALPAAKLEEIWKSLETQCGSFKSFGPQHARKDGGNNAISVPAEFDKAKLQLQLVFDKSDKITGFWIKPAEGADLSPKPSAPPPYDEPGMYTETAVEFGKSPWTINGKLTVPRMRVLCPVVVLVHGSGPHDEDETIGPNKVFRDLAYGLSSNGVAVLRYHKRTHAHKAELAKTGKITVREEVIDDALAALKFVRTQSNVDTSRVYLLGHSLGATLAPQIATDDKKLGGVVLLSGTSRNFYDVILGQLSYLASLPGPDQEVTRKLFEENRKKIALTRFGKAQPGTDLLGAPIGYWDDLNKYAQKAVPQAAALDCRILVCGGGRDHQITKEDFEIYRKGLGSRKNVTFKWYDDLNHLYMTGKGMSTPAEYEKAGYVDKKVIDDLAEWIREGS